jgi:hypothetical protein
MVEPANLSCFNVKNIYTCRLLQSKTTVVSAILARQLATSFCWRRPFFPETAGYTGFVFCQVYLFTKLT